MSDLYEKILQLKQEKRWLFYLLFVPFVLLGILELYNKYLSKSAENTVDNAEKKDLQLEKKQIKAEQGAKVHQEEAKEIEKEISGKQITKDWHLNE